MLFKRKRKKVAVFQQPKTNDTVLATRQQEKVTELLLSFERGPPHTSRVVIAVEGTRSFYPQKRGPSPDVFDCSLNSFGQKKGSKKSGFNERKREKERKRAVLIYKIFNI